MIDYLNNKLRACRLQRGSDLFPAPLFIERANMANIGRPIKTINVEPISVPVPVKEPSKIPDKEPEKVISK